MRHRRTTSWLFLSCCAVLLTLPVAAQVTSADYERANSIQKKYKGLVLNAPSPAVWIEGTNKFIYNKTVEGGQQFFVVDAQTGARQIAFDHERMAAALTKAAGEEFKALTLPTGQFRLNKKGTAILFRVKNSVWSCDYTAYTCSQFRGYIEFDDEDGEVFQPNRNPGIVKSPDGKWDALIRNNNVYLQSAEKKDITPLSFDGTDGNAYELQTLAWSPDSKHLVAYRVRSGGNREIAFIESSPVDQLQPRYSKIAYAKPGDVLDIPQPVLFDIPSKRQIIVDNALFPNPYEISRPVWWKDSRGFTFEYNQRGHQAYRVIEVTAETGTPRALVSEESKTFIYYPRLGPNHQGSGRIYRHDVKDGKEIIWMSERDGWAHLYLYDGLTGKVKNQITRGNWVVRAVDRIDEEKRQIWFRGSGMDAGKDPYFLYPFRINFDGTGLTRLASEYGDHSVSYSPDSKYFVDVWSRVDEPPVMLLRRTEDLKLVSEIERADISKLIAAGWRAPEVFTAMGRDGKTDIWGVIYRPATFDPSKKYPVIEDIYAGPQGSFVPKSFTSRVNALTELGFVVVQIDGMGTANRSKAFHDVAWKNLKDGGFPDRILWHKAAAAKYPWYDISRVGVFGTSAGGQNALAALLFHPEFYKAGVANCGCHDNRMDKIWWNELWMGWPIGPQYEACSNVANAHLLQGKLLLVVGEMDDNVDPASTMQVVNALIQADKKFDLLVVPGGRHGAGGAYGQRLLEDFFIHNLLGAEPPDWNSMPAKTTAKK